MWQGFTDTRIHES